MDSRSNQQSESKLGATSGFSRAASSRLSEVEHYEAPAEMSQAQKRETANEGNNKN